MQAVARPRIKEQDWMGWRCKVINGRECASPQTGDRVEEQPVTTEPWVAATEVNA